MSSAGSSSAGSSYTTQINSPTSSFLDAYDPLDIIGNGSFGIIRKVRRKSDGAILARKELNFERMSERDRKQIVAEVNILKDLHHDHIVRYHDRFVDRDAGILYILMEYCGGGDLSGVIKQAVKHERPIPEDTIWGYFMQILLALYHCHHPNGHGRSGSNGGSDVDSVNINGGGARRPQILHRDLKPDNVFLSSSNAVKLGDFGLSKALSQASFANTYVGTPYYMSPELMQEKAYDSKSDIWSLGCLMYELCALKPPFHEAKTHQELSILIRNGRVPPLPKGYSQGLGAVIKGMLSLNPAMRPSAAQLLQHERLELVFKVSETEKMLQTVKTHKAAVLAREKEVISREAALAQKEAEILRLQQELKDRQRREEYLISEAIAKREEELRVLVLRREEEVAAAMARREEEIIASVNKRESELCEAWAARERQLRMEWEDCERAMIERERVLAEETEKIDQIRREMEQKGGKLRAGPLEEVKNVLECHYKTPMQRQQRHSGVVASAMKGVVLTATGESLQTPAPELSSLFVQSPKVGLEFSKIFDEPPSPSPNERSKIAQATRLRRPSLVLRSTSSPKITPSSSLEDTTSDDIPSPFMKKLMKKRPSTGNMLRTVAATNSTRPAVARRASEDARKVLAK